MRNFSARRLSLRLSVCACFLYACISLTSCTPASLPDAPAAPEFENDDWSGGDNGGIEDEGTGDNGKGDDVSNDGRDEDAGDDEHNGNSGNDDSEDAKPEEVMTINVTVGGKGFKADIEATETGRAFVAKLPLTLDMSELNGNEKYCYGIALPRADEYFDTLAAGDLMLYAGDCVVLFYGPAGGYRYTRIGRLQSSAGLAAALGTSSATVTFERE